MSSLPPTPKMHMANGPLPPALAQLVTDTRSFNDAVEEHSRSLLKDQNRPKFVNCLLSKIGV